MAESVAVADVECSPPIGLGDIVEYMHRRDGIVVRGQILSKMRDLVTVYLTSPDQYAGEYAQRVITSVKRVGVGYYHYHDKIYTRQNGFLYMFVQGFATRADAVAYIATMSDRHSAYIVLTDVPDDTVPIPNISDGFSVWRESYTKKSLAVRRRRG
jgi:hypothetical protein